MFHSVGEKKRDTQKHSDPSIYFSSLPSHTNSFEIHSSFSFSSDLDNNRVDKGEKILMTFEVKRYSLTLLRIPCALCDSLKMIDIISPSNS